MVMSQQPREQRMRWRAGSLWVVGAPAPGVADPAAPPPWAADETAAAVCVTSGLTTSWPSPLALPLSESLLRTVLEPARTSR